MEAFDDVVGHHSASVGASETRDNSWEEFEDSVLAEERGKAKILSRIQTAARERGMSHNNLQEELREAEQKPSTLPRGDLRKHLFEAIPAPYPHPTNFQRVIITESGETPDRDTIVACQSLQKCLRLRERYIAAHNVVASSSPKVPFPMNNPDGFRRRAEPIYDVFGRPLPPCTDDYTVSWENGVFNVEPRLPDSNGELLPKFSSIPFNQFLSDYNYVCVESANISPPSSLSSYYLHMLLHFLSIGETNNLLWAGQVLCL
jgi:hypothetical protein